MNYQLFLEAVGKKVEHIDLDLLRSDMERFVMMSPQDFQSWLNRYVKETTVLLSRYQQHHENR